MPWHTPMLLPWRPLSHPSSDMNFLYKQDCTESSNNVHTVACSCVVMKLSYEDHVFSVSASAELTDIIWQPCPDQPECPQVYWAYSEWICTNEGNCGSGFATRNATCVAGSPPTAVDDLKCSDIPVDNRTQSCELGPCVNYYWKAKELADCAPEDRNEPCGKVRLLEMHCRSVSAD